MDDRVIVLLLLVGIPLCLYLANRIRRARNRSRTLAPVFAVTVSGTGKRTALYGEDAGGSRVELASISQSAILFVPRDAMRYLREDATIWSRVVNQTATFRESESLGAASSQPGRLLAAQYAGPLNFAMEARRKIDPSAFAIYVVESEHQATSALRMLSLFESA